MYCYAWNCIYGYNDERERDDAKRIKEIKKKKKKLCAIYLV